jgi:MFS family permease
MNKSSSQPVTVTKKSTLAGISHTFDALSEPSFRLLWLGTLFAQASMQINIVARSWLAYHISGSALALGYVALARGLPQSVLSLFGGAMADRTDKRKLLIIVQFSLAVLSALNALLVHLDIIRVWHLVVIGLLQGLIFAFNMPTRQALVPEVVSKDRLANALALNSTGMNLNRMLAPALAGVLIASHPAVAFDIVALFYVMSAIWLIQLPRTRGGMGVSRSSNALVDIKDGVMYLFGNRSLLVLIIMAFIPAMIGLPFQQLLPVFQKDVLHVGPSALGMMYTSVGIGSLIGSLSVAALSASPSKKIIQGTAGVIFGMFMVVFALSSFYHLSLVLLVGVGLASQGYMTINNVLLMEITDPAYYGRMMSIYMLTFSMSPVAMLPIGFFVDKFGVSTTVVVCGIVLSGSMLLFLGGGRRLIMNGGHRKG